MIVEAGVVIETRNDIAVVLVERTKMCKSCMAKGSCMESPTDTSVKVTAKNLLQARIGDKVELSISSKKLLTLSAAIYILPLLFLFVGAILGPIINEGTGIKIEKDIASALAGIIFLVVSFLAVALFTKRYKPGGEISPVIAAILQENIDDKSFDMDDG